MILDKLIMFFFFIFYCLKCLFISFFLSNKFKVPLVNSILKFISAVGDLKSFCNVKYNHSPELIDKSPELRGTVSSWPL